MHTFSLGVVSSALAKSLFNQGIPEEQTKTIQYYLAPYDCIIWDMNCSIMWALVSILHIIQGLYDGIM